MGLSEELYDKMVPLLIEKYQSLSEKDKTLVLPVENEYLSENKLTIELKTDEEDLGSVYM